MTKFLGVLLDQHLSWKYHITHVAKKVSKAIGIISKARFFLSSKSLLSLYYTLVYPYLNYCNIAWCSTYPSNSNRILYLQKRIVWIICGVEYLTHTALGLLQSLTFLTLMRSLLRVLCTHIIITSFLIRLTYTTFLTDRQVHTTCNTWNANNYQPYFCRTNIQQFTILHLGPKLWNSLPHNLTERTSYSSFKTSLKKYLIERAIN